MKKLLPLFRRHLWFWLICPVLPLLAVWPVYQQKGHYLRAALEESTVYPGKPQIIPSLTSIQAVTVMCLAVLAALLVSRWMMRPDETRMMTALPVRVRVLWLICAAEGFLMLMVSVWVSAGVTWRISGVRDMTQGFLMPGVYLALFAAWVYAVGLIMAMITGSTLIQFMMTAGIVMGPWELGNQLLRLTAIEQRGFVSDGWITVDFLFPYATFTDTIRLQQYMNSPWPLSLAGGTLLMLGVCVLAAGRRGPEVAGDRVSALWMQPCFLVLAGMVTGIVGGYFAHGQWLQSVWAPVAGAVCGCLAGGVTAGFLMERRWFSATMWKWVLPVAFLPLAAHLFLQADITGFVHRVPSQASVLSVELERGSAAEWATEQTLRPDSRHTEPTALSTGQASQISEVRAFHDMLVRNSSTDVQAEGRGVQVFLRYQLTDGSTLVREYALNTQEQERFTALMRQTEALESRYLSLKEPDRIRSVWMRDMFMPGVAGPVDVSGDKLFTEALRKDATAFECQHLPGEARFKLTLGLGGNTEEVIRLEQADALLTWAAARGVPVTPPEDHFPLLSVQISHKAGNLREFTSLPDRLTETQRRTLFRRIRFYNPQLAPDIFISCRVMYPGTTAEGWVTREEWEEMAP